MNAWFRRLPIRRKLIAMILTTSAAAVVLAAAGHMATAYYSTRTAAAEDLLAQARVVLDNADAAIRFDDQQVALEILQTIQSVTRIRTACLYRPTGEIFAARAQPGATDCPASPPADGIMFAGPELFVTTTRAEGAERRGTLHLRTDVVAVQQRIRDQGIIIAAVMLIAIGVAIMLSARLQRFVSQPVIDLSRTASAVSARGDYSLRAARPTDDELGTLVDAFNGMLERIQLREQELSRANDELRREVAERERAEQERAELLVREREANRTKDEFLATLSHELRTPLNAILGWTRLMRGHALPRESFDQALEKVERNAQVQARLVEDLLEVSRITTGKLRLDLRELDLVALATTAIDSIGPAAEARGVVMGHTFEAASLLTTGDPDRLQQVIWNLLSNAVKFTPEGGRVHVTLQRRGEIDEIVVSDTGIGIDPVFLPKVFETFRQADASATRAHGGLGLGLAIVRNLVELHGGTVSGHSAGHGQGATFTVRLPVRMGARRAAAPHDAAAGPMTSLLSGFSVLAVDDDPDTRELLEAALLGAGARVFAAGSAEKALEISRREPIDALVSDIAMPGRDGYSLIKELRAGPNQVPRVAIALSAYAAPQDHRRSLDAGFHRHVGKPVDPAMLVETLRELLDMTEPTAG